MAVGGAREPEDAAAGAPHADATGEVAVEGRDDLDPARDPSALADTVAGARSEPRGAAEPTMIGRYQVHRRLGAGGMGTVYAAHDPILDREVAVKLLERDDRPGRLDRLLREAQAMAKLSHPNVAQVYEAGTHEGQVFIAMELIHGETLRVWIEAPPRASARGPATPASAATPRAPATASTASGPVTPAHLSIPEIIERFVAAGRGLEAAHAAGVVHRDFKPDNVLVGADGRVVVVDFGVARLGRPLAMPRGGPSSDSSPAAKAGIGGTADGRIVGTPAYMSPEQWLGGTVDARSDQFSFAAALFEAIHGRRPFAGDNVVDLARNVLSGTIAPPRDRRAPRWLDRLLLRALQVHPERRFADMSALLAALTRERERRRRRWIAAVGGLAIAGGLGFGAAAIRHSDPCVDAGDRIHAVWSPERRAAIERALGGDGAGYALTTWTRIDERLDAYAQAWEAGVRDACRATRVRAEASEELLDRRSACMGIRLRAFEAVVTLFEREGEAALDRAIEALAGLPAIELCADVEQVRRRYPPPANLAVATAVELLRERLAEIQAATEVSDPRPRLADLEAIEREAVALGYGPLLAEVLALHGGMLARIGDPAGAVEVLRRGYREAIASGHDEVALEIALTLGVNERPDPEPWLLSADALVDRLRAPELVRARYHYVRLLRACEDGRCDEPVAPLIAAIEGHRRAVGDGHPTLASLEVELANIHMLRREVREAEAAYVAALDLYEQILGPKHPRLLISLGNLARLALNRGDLEAAAVWIGRATAIADGGYSDAHPFVIGLRRLEADLAGARGDVDEAVAILERALDAGAGAATTTLLQQRLHLVLIERLAGRRAEARAILRQIAGSEALVADDELEWAVLTALVEVELGEVATARAALDRARTLLRDGVPGDAGTRLYERLAGARIAAAEGDRSAAIAELEALRDGADDDADIGEAEAALAHVWADDPAAARAHAAAADRALGQSPPHYRLLRRELADFAAGLPGGPAREGEKPR
ncbi:MAG: protein kinase [Nannocystaceae bacterium]